MIGLTGALAGVAVTSARAQSPAVSAAQTAVLQIVGASRPPYVIERDGVGSGPAVELVQPLATPSASIRPSASYPSSGQ